ncbi:hypothetical protein Q5692_23355 [Microcoleus sp. C2C3]|uniref:hypothetical protein n=1 Tax=unclassified Microcoleus TaxID=2642155 RepID=UPI002FD55526
MKESTLLKGRILRIASYATLIVLAIFYGMAAHKFQLPPSGFVSAAFKHIGVRTPKEYLETPKEYLETDVTQLISIRQQQDVSRLRRELIAVLWGNPGIPLSLPSAVDEGFTDTRYKDISSLSEIDKLSIVMEFGIESYVYHFIPKTPNNKVVLYHQGHDGDFYESKVQIRRFLDSGYSVAAFSMPLLGFNNQPTVQLPRQGKLKLTSHDHMKFLLPKNGHPVKYFVEPVAIVLNYLEKNFDYSSVSMVGISGGGWTTTLAAAIDTRIEKSFPVAGSYPIYLRSNSQRDWGDYEQTVPEIYRTVNDLELYILGSYGLHRKQLQVINQYDSCCFAGTKWETYKDIIRERVHELGTGEFELFLDATHREHLISEAAMSRILDELASNSR